MPEPYYLHPTKPWYKLWWVWLVIAVSCAVIAPYVVIPARNARYEDNPTVPYQDLPHTVVITVSNLANPEDYAKAQRLIEAKVTWVVYQKVNRPIQSSIGPTFELLEDSIVAIFGFGDGFDIDRFIEHLLATPQVVFRDSEGRVIIDSEEVMVASEDWPEETMSYVTMIHLTEKGMADFTSAIADREGEIRVTIEFEGSPASDEYLIEVAGDSSVIVRSIGGYEATAEALAALLMRHQAPIGAVVSVEID